MREISFSLQQKFKQQQQQTKLENFSGASETINKSFFSIGILSFFLQLEISLK